MAPQEPDRLRELGSRLDEARRRKDKAKSRPPSGLGIAGRITTELVGSLVVGGGLGWGLDWLLGRFGIHTKPVFLIVFFILGAAAGILNVMRAAAELNAPSESKERASKDVEK